MEIKKNGTTKRLLWIDCSKGIGIILVVYGHVVRGLYDAHALNATYYFNSDTFVYSFHMPLFFILSGYTFYNSFIKNQAGFIPGKLKTLVYPFVVWSLLQTAVEILLSNLTTHKTSPDMLIWCIFIPRAQFWFLYALFFICIINFVSFKISLKYGLFLSLILWLGYFILNPTLGPFAHIFQNLIFFDAGIIFSQFNNRFLLILKSNMYLLVNAIAFCVIEYLYFATNQTHTFNYNYLFIIVAISGSLLIMQISHWATSKKLSEFFIGVGRLSLAIYLSHILVISGMRIVLFKIFKIYNPVMNISIATIAGIIIPSVIFRPISKTPYLSWLFTFPSNKKNPKTSPEVSRGI
ncbi:acyltransferase family protein [Mucilaginibacter sp.]|jgi:fucose 4-O-acetylase-like acetyltransferase|uniref:acyltransferase family protein n=1 Tax=Mucilaginibacter sp. TaxID=1882438 RepID=UPI003564AAFF